MQVRIDGSAPRTIPLLRDPAANRDWVVIGTRAGSFALEEIPRMLESCEYGRVLRRAEKKDPAEFERINNPLCGSKEISGEFEETIFVDILSMFCKLHQNN